MHPLIHAKSSVRKWGGKIEDYLFIHEWFDETKAWVGHSEHRLLDIIVKEFFNQNKYLGQNLLIVKVRLYTQDMLVNNMLKKIVSIISLLQKNG